MKGLPPLKGGAPHEKFIEDAAQRVEVAGGNGLSHCLLGRHVDDRAGGGVGSGEAGLAGLGLQGRGNAEVEDLDLAVRGDHQVRRLQVAVYDILPVGVGEHLGSPPGNVRGSFDGQRTIALERGIEAAPPDEFHDQVELSLVAAVIVDGGDARVFQTAGEARLTQKPALQRAEFGAEATGSKELDGHFTAAVAVVRRPDDAHAASAQLARQLVLPKASPHCARPQSRRPWRLSHPCDRGGAAHPVG